MPDETDPTASPTSDSAPDRDDVMEALENVIDPELGLDFVSLGLVYDVEIEDRDVHITFTLTTPACPIGPQVTEQMKEFVGEVEGVEKVSPEDGLLADVVPGAHVRGREVRARVLDGPPTGQRFPEPRTRRLARSRRDRRIRRRAPAAVTSRSACAWCRG